MNRKTQELVAMVARFEAHMSRHPNRDDISQCGDVLGLAAGGTETCLWRALRHGWLATDGPVHEQTYSVTPDGVRACKEEAR